MLFTYLNYSGEMYMKYQSWFDEIRTTKINKQNGQVKIYKLVLLLCMLDRGMYDWYKPVRAEEIALRFYRYLTDNDRIRDISFGDKGKEKLIHTYNQGEIIRLIINNPMKYWGSSNNRYTHARYKSGVFWIDISIDPEDYSHVYHMTRELCLARIEKETNIPFDTKIDLHDEYVYLQKEVQNEKVAETEKESIILTRLSQGKFRNRLFERYGSCIMCGIEHRDLLIASHIKPWKDSNNQERLDVENGFILCPNHDKLFDRGFITFKDDGEVIVSNRIVGDVPRLSISDKILCNLSYGNMEYLEWHRDEIFEV